MQEEENDQKYFVFDVESLGLFGSAFAMGGIVIDTEGNEMEEVYFAYDPWDQEPHMEPAEFRLSGFADSVQWVKDNVLPSLTVFNCDHVGMFFKGCVNAMASIQNMYPGIIFVADCVYPVETNFLTTLNYCQIGMKNNQEGLPEGTSEIKPIYPLIDISSMLLSQGYDPVGRYGRMKEELPVHNPLMDARQSARILMYLLDGDLYRLMQPCPLCDKRMVHTYEWAGKDYPNGIKIHVSEKDMPCAGWDGLT